jgi:hypothetical protein
MAWTHLRHEDPALARRYCLDSVEAYTDVASVRGVGLSLIGSRPPSQSSSAPIRQYKSLQRRRSTPSRKASSTSTPTRHRAASSSTGHERPSPPTRSPEPRRSAAGSRSGRHSISPGSPKRPRCRPTGPRARGRAGVLPRGQVLGTGDGSVRASQGGSGTGSAGTRTDPIAGKAPSKTLFLHRALRGKECHEEGPPR